MIPTPKERPDLYDGYDCQGPRNPTPEKYWDRIMPEHVRQRIAKRKAKAQAEPVKDAAE